MWGGLDSGFGRQVIGTVMAVEAFGRVNRMSETLCHAWDFENSGSVGMLDRNKD